jgi:hypothetical protein
MMRRFFLSLFVAAGLSTAATIELDQSTTLLNSSTFTAGNTYIAAFQLSGGGFSSSQALASLFDLSTGAGFAQDPLDIVTGLVVVGPNSSLPAGIWQPDGTLSLEVNLVDAFAVYTQAFQAGTTFRFTYSLITDNPSAIVPDQFTFQLYDDTLSTLLYEVTEDSLNDGQLVPEPATWMTGLLGCGLLWGAYRRRRL